MILYARNATTTASQQKCSPRPSAQANRTLLLTATQRVKASTQPMDKNNMLRIQPEHSLRSTCESRRAAAGARPWVRAREPAKKKKKKEPAPLCLRPQTGASPCSRRRRAGTPSAPGSHRCRRSGSAARHTERQRPSLLRAAGVQRLQSRRSTGRRCLPGRARARTTPASATRRPPTGAATRRP